MSQEVTKKKQLSRKKNKVLSGGSPYGQPRELVDKGATKEGGNVKNLVSRGHETTCGENGDGVAFSERFFPPVRTGGQANKPKGPLVCNAFSVKKKKRQEAERTKRKRGGGGHRGVGGEGRGGGGRRIRTLLTRS